MWRKYYMKATFLPFILNRIKIKKKINKENIGTFKYRQNYF